MLTHRMICETVEAIHDVIPPQEHRLVSLLPLSHLMEQVAALFYALTVGADILYVRSRNPRVIFEAIRDHRVTTMLVVPQILDLFWSAVEREVEASGRQRQLRPPSPSRPQAALRRPSDPLPPGPSPARGRAQPARLRRGVPAAPAPAGLGGLGVVVMQGYGATECGMASVTTKQDHGLGTVGRTIPPIQVRLADDGEIQVAGPTLFSGLLARPRGNGRRVHADGWYRTGDIGRHDETGHLILMGRTKDIIVLPNGLNVYPEDIENALRVAGIRDSVVIETPAGPDRGGRPCPGQPCPAPRRRHPGPWRERPARRQCRSGGDPGDDRVGRPRPRTAPSPRTSG